MTLPAIAIGALGSTIAMVVGKSGGVEPELTADMLAKTVPDIGNLANIHAQTLTNLPSGSLSFEVLIDALNWPNSKQTMEQRASLSLRERTHLKNSLFCSLSIGIDPSRSL